MQLQLQQPLSDNTNRGERRELLVRVCGNRHSQDVYVISPFFACISADRAPPPSVPSSRGPRFLSSLHSPRCSNARDERFINAVANGCRRTGAHRSINHFPLLLFSKFYRAFLLRFRNVRCQISEQPT